MINFVQRWFFKNALGPTVSWNLQIMDLFFSVELEEEDSYVFLSAVNAMSALASKWSDYGVPILLRLFVEESRGPEVRVKVGEVLTKLCVELSMCVLSLLPVLDGSRQN